MANRFEKYVQPPAPAPTGNRFEKYTATPATPEGAPQQGPGMPSPDTLRQMRLRSIARAAAGDPGVTRDAMTLGLQKPVSGLASVLGGEISELFGGEPATAGERWTAGTSGYQDALDEAKANAGTLGTVGGVVGSLAAGGPLKAGAAAIPSIAKTIGTSGVMGGVEGAARSSETPGEALAGGAIGAGTGAATAGALQAVGKGVTAPLSSFRARRASLRGPTPDALKNQARTLYDKLDQSSTAYSKQQSKTLAQRIRPALRNENIMIRDMPVAQDIIAHRRRPMTLEELQRYRTQASDLARSSDTRERRMAGVLLREIDDFVGRENPALSTLPPGDVDKTWGEARKLWRTASLADDLGFAVDKAQRRAASTASGGNVENAIRQNVRGVRDRVTKPGAYNPYSPETIGQMDKIIEGTWGHNRLRAVGNTLGGSGPIGNIAPFGFAGLAASQFGGLDPATSTALAAGAWGLGKAARKGSQELTERAADRLIGDVARGGQPPQSFAQQMTGAPTRERLAALIAALGPSAAGRYMSGQATGR